MCDVDWTRPRRVARGRDRDQPPPPPPPRHPATISSSSCCRRCCSRCGGTGGGSLTRPSTRAQHQHQHPRRPFSSVARRRLAPRPRFSSFSRLSFPTTTLMRTHSLRRPHHPRTDFSKTNHPRSQPPHHPTVLPSPTRDDACVVPYVHRCSMTTPRCWRCSHLRLPLRYPRSHPYPAGSHTYKRTRGRSVGG